MGKLLVSLSVICLILTGVNISHGQTCTGEAAFDYSMDTHTVYFFDETPLEDNQEIVNWFWNLGDGSVSEIQNPIHTYNDPNLYTVCLTAYISDDSENLCEYTYCKVITIANSYPCSVNGNFLKEEVEAGEFIFNSDVSSGMFTNVNAVLWSFGDGTEEDGEFATHQFTESGTYEVCMQVQGESLDNTCENIYCETIVVELPVVLEYENGIVVTTNDNCSFGCAPELFIPQTAELVSATWVINGELVDESNIGQYFFEDGESYMICLTTVVEYEGYENILEVCEDYTFSCDKDGIPDVGVGLSNNDLINSVDLSETSFISETKKVNADVYPNPCNDVLMVRVEKSGDLFKIFDHSGRLVENGLLDNGTNTIDVSSLDAGMYFISIGEQFSQKIVIR